MLAAVAAMAAAVPAAGQEIVNFTVPTQMCNGDSSTVSFGYQDSRSIVIEQRQSVLGHSERIFLPDGVSCGSMGCSYQSVVTFSDFAPGSTITSVNDIDYVRINMEHSYLGDIYINITCPNGQKASLMNYGGSGTSTCNSSIPSAHRGWSSPSYNNTSGNTYLGIPVDDNNSQHPCDSAATDNEPGIGWNYCWSNNTTNGYQYAPGDGLIYRAANVTTAGYLNTTIDSSNVAAGTNFYHPQQSFSNLVGCPMNGDWYIEVLDGWSTDNGYLFEWELSLNAELLPQDDCEVTGYDISGYGVTTVNDSTFIIAAPTDLTHDTTIAYTYTIHSTCGDIDSTVDLTFHPEYRTETFVEGCERYNWKGHNFTASATIQETAHTAHGCDSLSRVHITVHPGYHLVQSRTVVENALPYAFNGRTFNDDVTDSLLTDTTTFGCDSNITFTLTVFRNVATDIYDTVCANTLPYPWNGFSVAAAGDTQVNLLTSHGADSVVTLHLALLPYNDSVITKEIVENELPYTILGREYHSSVDTTEHHTNAYGCDSTITIRIIVHPNHAYSYSRTVCNDQLPYSWDGHTFNDADTVVQNLTDQYGADSVVTLMLTTIPSYSIAIDTTICDNHPLHIADHVLETSGTYSIRLTSTQGCDSLITVDLTVNPHDEFTLHDTICANDSYTFGDYTYNHSGTYVYTYTNAYGCDSTVTLKLGILAGDLKADIRAIPLIVSTAAPDFQLHDNSAYATSRLWIIEDNNFSQHSLSYTFPDGIDTLPVTLVAYSPEGCADTARTTILIDRSIIFTPNAFTPSESTNNTWQPVFNQLLDLEVWIYTRSGLLVNHLEGTDLRWDGTTADGTACPQGAYVYSLQYRTLLRPQELHTLTGTILLIR